MNSENLKDKARVFLFYPNSSSQDQVLQLSRAISQTVFPVSIKADSVDKMPELISKIRPDDCATVILITNNLQPSQSLQEVVNKIEHSQNLLIMYPKAVGPGGSRTIVAKTHKQVVDACSRQAAMIISRHNGSLVLSEGSNATGGPSQINAPLIVVNYIRSSDADLNNSVQQLKAKYASQPLVGFNPISTLADIKYQKNQKHMLIVPTPEATRMAAELANFSDKKYIFPVLLSRTGQVDPAVASAYKFTASDHNILDVELSTAIQKVIASKANKMMMQGGQMTQGGYQGGQTTTYTRTVQMQNGQMNTTQNQYRVGSQIPMASINQPPPNPNVHQGTINQLQMMNTQPANIATNQSLLVIEDSPMAATTTVTTTRATSSPPVMTGSNVANTALAAATAAALQTQNELHNRIGPMSGHLGQMGGQTQQLRISNLAGRAPLNTLVSNEYYQGKMASSANQQGGMAMSVVGNLGRRPQSANQPIRMKSAQKVLKNQPSVRVQPIVYVLKSQNPYFMEAIDLLGIVPGYHPVQNFPPGAQLAPNCVIIAPHQKRNQVMSLIGLGNNRTARVALVGQEIRPDRSFNHPQVELITQRIDYLRNYLKSKSIRMNQMLPPNITSLGKMPLHSSMVGSQVAQANNAADRSPMHKPLSTIHQQRSVYSNSIESNVKPVTPPMNQSSSGQNTAQLPQVSMLPAAMSAVGPIMPAGVPRIQSTVHIHGDGPQMGMGVQSPMIPRPISPLNIGTPSGPELTILANKPRTPVTIKSNISNASILPGNYQREWIVRKTPGSSVFSTVNALQSPPIHPTVTSGYQPPIVRTPSPVHMSLPGVPPNIVGALPPPFIPGIGTSAMNISPPMMGTIAGAPLVPIPPIAGVIPGIVPHLTVAQPVPNILASQGVIGSNMPPHMSTNLQPYKKQWIARRDSSSNKFITYAADNTSLISESAQNKFPPSQGVMIGGSLTRPTYDSPQHIASSIPMPMLPTGSGLVDQNQNQQPSLHDIGMLRSQANIGQNNQVPSIKQITSNNQMPPMSSGGILIGSSFTNKSIEEQSMVMRNPAAAKTMVTQTTQNQQLGVQPNNIATMQQNFQQNSRPWSGILPNGGPVPAVRLNKNEGIEMTNNPALLSGNTSQKSSDANEPRRKKKSTQWRNNDNQAPNRPDGLYTINEAISEEKRSSDLRMGQDLNAPVYFQQPQANIQSSQLPNRNSNNSNYLPGMEAPDLSKLPPIPQAARMQQMPAQQVPLQQMLTQQLPVNQMSNQHMPLQQMPNQAGSFPMAMQPNSLSQNTAYQQAQQFPHNQNMQYGPTHQWLPASDTYCPPKFNVENAGKQMIVGYNNPIAQIGPSITYQLQDKGYNPNLKFIEQPQLNGHMNNADLTISPNQLQHILNHAAPRMQQENTPNYGSFESTPAMMQQGFASAMGPAMLATGAMPQINYQAQSRSSSPGRQQFEGFGMHPTNQQLPYENVQEVSINQNQVVNMQGSNVAQQPQSPNQIQMPRYNSQYGQPPQTQQLQQNAHQQFQNQPQLQPYQQQPMAAIIHPAMQPNYQSSPMQPTLQIPNQQPAWQQAASSKHSTGSAPAQPLSLQEGIYQDTSAGYDDSDPYFFRQTPDLYAKGSRSPQLYKSIPSDTKTIPYETRNSFSRENNHIKFENNNLQNPQRISNVTQNQRMPNFDNQNYEMRIENGISIVSRRKTPQRTRNSQNSYEYRQQVAPMGLPHRMAESVHNLPRTSSLDRNHLMYSSMKPAQVRRVESLDRHYGDKNSYRSGGASGVLFVVPENNDQLRQGLYNVCTQFDKLMKYASEDELDRVSYENYGAVYVFPLNQRNPPAPRASNAYNILRNVSARNQQQIGIRDLSQLRGHTRNYHETSGLNVMQSPVTTFSIPRSNSLVTGDYKVLLRQNLRRDVQLDAYIDPQFVSLTDLQYKLKQSTNFIIVIGQNELQQVYRWKKDGDRIMVMTARNHPPPSLPVDVWTDDPRVMEDAVKRAVGSKVSRIPSSPSSVYGNSKPRIFYSFDNAQVEDAFRSQANRIQLIKYYNLENLIAKLRQHNNDSTIVVLNQKMAPHLANLRDMARQCRFILYGASGYRSSYTDSDVHESPNLSSLARQIRAMI